MGKLTTLTWAPPTTIHHHAQEWAGQITFLTYLPKLHWPAQQTRLPFVLTRGIRDSPSQLCTREKGANCERFPQKLFVCWFCLWILESCPTSWLQSLAIYNISLTWFVADQIALKSSVECSQNEMFYCRMSCYIRGVWKQHSYISCPYKSLMVGISFHWCSVNLVKNPPFQKVCAFCKFMGKDGEVFLQCLIMMHDLAWGCCCVIVVMVMENSTVEVCWHHLFSGSW